MTATQAKYYLHAAHEVSKDGGIGAILCDPRSVSVPVLGGAPLFPDITNVEDAWVHCRDDPVVKLRQLSGELAGREGVGQSIGASVIAGTCGESLYGNRAVYGLAHLLLTQGSGLSIQPSAGFKHAERCGEQLFSALCHGSNLNPDNCIEGFRTAKGSRQDHVGEHAADHIASIYSIGSSKDGRRKQNQFNSKVCSSSARKHCFQSSTQDQILNGVFIQNREETSLKENVQKHLGKLTVTNSGTKDDRHGTTYSRTYVSGNALYWVHRPRQNEDDPPKLTRLASGRSIGEHIPGGRDARRNAIRNVRGAGTNRSNLGNDGGVTSVSHGRGATCFVLFERDRRDIIELLNSFDALRTFARGRLLEIIDPTVSKVYKDATDGIIEVWLDVCSKAGKSLFLSNNVGTLMDQVVWISLADLAGKKYFDHPQHMREKAVRKVPGFYEEVNRMVSKFATLPVDCRIDLFGINKLSVYPQVCAYGTVLAQLEKHCLPHDCSFSSGSEVDNRRATERSEMFVYMRYLYVRIFQQAHGYAPGEIKDDAENKVWHDRYRIEGVPSEKWRECVDVDLRGTMAIADPDFDSYLGLADSSCAPADLEAYSNMSSYILAPRYEKRKLLYLLQHPNLPDVSAAHETLKRAGDRMDASTIAAQNVALPFSQDISTGMRFEKQKPAGRPFYQLCAPLGCLVSNLESSVRAFLRRVPQSLMSMTLKDRGESAIKINSILTDIMERFLVSDDKAAYSPSMDPESQAGTSDFFAEVTGDGSFRSINNILMTNELYYRVHDKLIHYPSNGTDREGLRGAQNTWLEIVCHGYHTRILREKGICEHKTAFIGFIDDALRRYEKEYSDGKTDVQRVHEIIADLEEKLRIIGRALSWDKAYVSETLSTILGEVFYSGLPMANGSKSFISFAEIEEKYVEDAASLEGNYASKAIGAMAAGAPLVLSFQAYIHNVTKQHHRLGVRLSPGLSIDEYAVWCMTPIAFGGAGMRGILELDCTETGSRTAAGVGNLIRLVSVEPQFNENLSNLLSGPFEEVSDIDFLRDPAQIHVSGPRIRTQRVNQFIRKKLGSIATSEKMRELLAEETANDERLHSFAREMRKFSEVDVQEVKTYYAASAQSQIDAIVTKICSADSVKGMMTKTERSILRRQVRMDAFRSAAAFRYRLEGLPIPEGI
jgi:hypothetical protein